MIDRKFIQKSCRLSGHRVEVDGACVWESSTALSVHDFAKEAFQQLQITYPKFYKMDSLSKLAFLGAEYILQGEETEGLALVLANRSGSLDTDILHQASIADMDNFYPRPATFVYTLANICAGEIAIRHALQTEQAFFVTQDFPKETMMTYVDYLLQSGKATGVLYGWVELLGEDYEVDLCLAII